MHLRKGLQHGDEDLAKTPIFGKELELSHSRTSPWMNARTGFQVLRHDSYLKPSAILNTFISPPVQKNLAPQRLSFSQENLGAAT